MGAVPGAPVERQNRRSVTEHSTTEAAVCVRCGGIPDLGLGRVWITAYLWVSRYSCWGITHCLCSKSCGPITLATGVWR